MKFVFNAITALAVRFRIITFALAISFLVLGGVAATDLNQELLPPIDLPQTIVLGQVTGMTSDQVLAIITERLEAEIAQIGDVTNIESQTTGSFGVVLTAFNDFGLDQASLRGDIQDAINSVWLPLRTIAPDNESEAQDFAQQLLSDIPPDLIVYLAAQDPNFLFQLSPEVWDSLSDTTVRTALSYLADQVQNTTGQQSALARLVENEVIPQLQTIEGVASVTVSGGQALPGEEGALAVDPDAIEGLDGQSSLLLTLSPDVWEVVAPRFDDLDTLDESAVNALNGDVTVPDTIPALPESWQFPHFSNAEDLLELRTLTVTLADVFNDFYTDGSIRGALGQTDDLTVETLNRMLEIAPSMVMYFEAEHLAAMPTEVFEALPEDFVANLDGFTRDALAASALAEEITGEAAERVPVDLPDPWRISPPQIITFSFADIPLATFTVASDGAVTPASNAAATGNADDSDAGESGTEDGSATSPWAGEDGGDEQDIPEGPPLAPIFSIVGAGFGVTLDTADDLLSIPVPEALAAQSPIEIDTLSAADFINFLAAPDTLAGGDEAAAAPFDPTLLLNSLTPEVMLFLAEYDPDFVSQLSPATFDALPASILDLPEFAPPLANVWDVLAQQPQFADVSLNTAADVIAIGDGSASQVLNAINTGIPGRFAGYEVRLFDSISPAVLRYFRLNEDGFAENIQPEVMLKMSSETLASLPPDFFDAFEDDVATELLAIADGEQESAFTTLQAELYTTEAIPPDPSAPALNPEWQTLAGFIAGVSELNNAFDLFRFPDATGTPAEFVNSLFDSSQGRGFAPSLLGNLSLEAFEYIAESDPNFANELVPEALRLLPDTILETLSASVRDRAEEGGNVFTPTAQVTRTNNAPSLLVTIFKTQEANTVSTYSAVESAILSIDEGEENIVVGIAFEQSSFIEDSISGVAREGTLGAIFAIVIILIFLSSGQWSRRPRTVVGAIMTVLFLALLAALVASQLGAADGDIGQAFASADVVIRLLFIVGAIAGLVILLWPGQFPDPAWRATLVIAVSIPLSILSAFIAMRFFTPAMNDLISPLAEGSPFFTFVLRLFPNDLTLNIMTLSGMTVAVGRVVDDSIVVLENIFKQLQAGEDKKTAILSGTRDVSAAIFVATMIAVVVFLPLGLTGGIIGAFFLPFGLAVTYALVGSFVVALTVVPSLAYIFIDTEDIPDEDEEFWLARFYTPVLRLALANRVTITIVIVLAVLSAGFGGFLFGQRPAAFLPDFGEPQVTVNVELPPATRIVETNAMVSELESYITDTVPEGELGTIQTVIGGSGLDFEALLTGNSVAENRANITVGLNTGPDQLDEWTQIIRNEAEAIFGADNVVVSAASVATGGFGGFSLVVSGPSDVLAEYDPIIIDTLNDIEGIANVSSNLSEAAASTDPSTTTIIRVNQQSAISYSAELETEDTIGVTADAIAAIEALPDLPDSITVSQGFESEIQTEGFQSLGIAIGIALMIVIAILFVTFSSPVYWLAIIFSVVTAPVGAAIALTLTDRVLGISALIGLLMLLGLVITNAVVLLDRVRSNISERDMQLYDALIEAGARRLRPILMTSLATIIALMPLTVGLSEGAIIASELGTVVVGGVFSSTLLTLIVVPVVYYVLTPVHRFLLRLVGMKPRQ